MTILCFIFFKTLLILNCSDMMSRVNSNETMEESDGNPVGITSRLWSNLSSLYQNYDFHLDSVKVRGVVVLLSLINAILVITNHLHVCQSRQNISDCIQLRTHPVDDMNSFNASLYGYIQQLYLPKQYRVTVCFYQKEVQVDFRQFIDENATIVGLCLNRRQ